MSLQERYQAVHSELMQFTDHPTACHVAPDKLPEFMKTTAAMFAILERVRLYLDGEPQSFIFHNIQDEAGALAYLDHIEHYMAAVKNGTFPFEGRFIENGCTVIDHSVVKKGEWFHLFYIRGKIGFNWSESPTQIFGHAVSTDLKNWIPLEPVVPSTPDTFDRFQVWAPHIIEKDARYYMFYCGVNEHAAQTIGLAVSNDLYLWSKPTHEPVIDTSGWGYWGTDHWSDCRDPMVVFDGEHYYMYYTRNYVKDGGLVCCIGVSSSDDLLHWTDRGYIDVPDSPDLPLESPFMVYKDGRYYLFYTHYYVGTCCMVSDNPVSGFRKENWGVIDRDLSASEVVEDQGRYYLTRITHEPGDVHLFDVRPLNFHDGMVELG